MGNFLEQYHSRVSLEQAVVATPRGAVYKGILSEAIRGQSYYLTKTGGFSPEPPSDGPFVKVGYALNKTDLYVDIKQYGELDRTVS